jgi:hypothetical protein
MSTRITRIDVLPLPRWGRLALAARCLARARSLVKPKPEHAAVLDKAITGIVASAETGEWSEGLAESAAAAYSLALDELDSPSRTEEAHDQDVVTCMVAHAAAFAAEAASQPDAHRAAHLVAQSVDFVVHAFRLSKAAQTEEAMAAMRADLEKLWSAEPDWNDHTPVPQSFFGE